MGQNQSIPAPSDIKLETPIDQTNAMLEKANAILSCGPDCQDQNNTADLLTKYQNAQVDILNDHEKLGYTATSYYTYAEGPAGAAKFNDQKMQNVAKTIGDEAVAKFNTLKSSTTNMLTTYATEQTNYQHAKDYYDDLKEKNKNLKKKLETVTSFIETNDKKGYYENQQVEHLLWWYRVFWWTFMVLSVVYIICFFLVPSNYSWSNKLMILVGFAAYFFFARYIFIYIFAFFQYMISFIPTNVYLGGV